MPGCGAAAIPLVLSAAGTGVQMAANAQAEREMNRKVRQELARQSQFQQQASAEYAKSAAQGTPEVAKRQLGEGEAARGAEYSQAQNIPLVSGAAPMTAPQQLSTGASIGAGNLARGQNAAYEDFLLQQILKNIQAGQNIGMLGNFAQGSQRVLPHEVQDAQHSGDNLRGIGQLLGTAGTLWSLGSMGAGMGAGVASPGAASTGVCGG